MLSLQEQDLVETSMATDNDIVHTAAEALVIFSNRDHSAAGPSSAVPSCSTAPSQPCSSLQSAKEDDPMVCSIMLPDDLKQNLECPVCTRISLPPIMQCRNGHVTCNQCRLKVQSCPMCREVDIDIRYVQCPILTHNIQYKYPLETCLRRKLSHLCPFHVNLKPMDVE